MGTQTPSFIMLMESTLNTPRDDINTSNANFSFSMAMIPMVSNLEKVHESLISKSVQNATNSVRILGGLIQNQLDNLLQNQLEKIQNQLEKSAWENMEIPSEKGSESRSMLDDWLRSAWATRLEQIKRTMVITSKSGCLSLTSPTEVTNTTVKGQPIDTPTEVINATSSGQPIDTQTEGTNTTVEGQPIDTPTEGTNTTSSGQPLDTQTEGTNTTSSGQPIDTPTEGTNTTSSVPKKF